MAGKTKRRPARPLVRIETTSLGGREIALRIRKSPRAKRLGLRLDPTSGEVELVVPPGVPHGDAKRFLNDHENWVLEQLGELPPRVPFGDGTVLPLLGGNVRLRHRPALPATAFLAGQNLFVGGKPDMFAAVVTEWLRQCARDTLYQKSLALAARIGMRVERVTIRDPRTRWASCSHGGRLSFSWRLVLAPPDVTDYVVAHEVAHLRHMNHGPSFWALVTRLAPGHDVPREWLRRNGQRLHRYG